MFSIKLNWFPKLVLVALLGLASSAWGQLNQQTSSGNLNAGSILCFPVTNPTVQPNSLIAVAGFAKNANTGNPIDVKWSIWAGPTTDTTTYTRYFELTGPNPVPGSSTNAAVVDVGIQAGQIPPGDYAQACINNNTAKTVTFSITEYWE